MNLILGFYWCIITQTVYVLEIRVFAKAAYYVKIPFMTQHAVTFALSNIV